MTYPLPTGFAFLDTETGGLDDRVNPLLSIAVVFADPLLKEIDGFALKVLPPDGTLLEIPYPEYQNPAEPYRPRKIATYYDVRTKESIAPERKPPTALIISAGAAEVNGFVGVREDDGKWDLAACDRWRKHSQPLAEISKVYTAFLHVHFQEKLVLASAHNASFDHKFVSRYLPELYARFWTRPAGTASPFPYRKPNSTESHDWYCTMLAFQAFLGGRKGSKLADLAEKCGHVHDKAHEALSDARAGLAGLRWLIQQGYGPQFSAVAG